MRPDSRLLERISSASSAARRMPISFGLVVQRIARAADQVLVIGHLVGFRAGDGWFTPGDVARMFETLRLPTPGGISQAL